MISECRIFNCDCTQGLTSSHKKAMRDLILHEHKIFSIQCVEKLIFLLSKLFGKENIDLIISRIGQINTFCSDTEPSYKQDNTVGQRNWDFK